MEVATTLDLYKEYAKICHPSDDGQGTDALAGGPAARKEAVLTHGLNSILVCGCIGRPDSGRSIPMLMVLGGPTPVSYSQNGSPWQATMAQMPEVFDGRDEHDQFNIHLGSLLGFSQNASAATLSKATVATYMYHAMFFNKRSALFDGDR